MLITGIKRIWDEDCEFQTNILKAIIKGIRKIEDPLLIDRLFEKLKSIGAFYVPTSEYMIRYFGPEITESQYGIFYDSEVCKYTLRLVLPMTLFDGTIVGFIGYTNENDVDPEDETFIKYLYPPKYVLDKRRYMYITPEEFKKAYEEEYICIIDGLFDQHSLTVNGINAVSLCGSALTSYHKMYLSTIKHIIVIADNDPAGRKLYNSIKKAFPYAVEIIQTLAWDVDDFMKTQDNIKKIQDTLTLMKLEGYCVNHVIK